MLNLFPEVTNKIFFILMTVSFLFTVTQSSILAETEGEDSKKDEGISIHKSLKDLKIGLLTYVDYSNGSSPKKDSKDEKYSETMLKRGYLTVKKKFTPWLKARMTYDIHQEDEGDFEGDYNTRLKYGYAEIHFPDLGPVLTNIKSEIGMGHMPWLDFEEHINPYRCQGTMAIERAGIFNSADLGIGLMGYFGPELKNAEEKTGSHYYTGQFGSWHVGVYNGSGYHAVEKNRNKVVEGRVTIRPLSMIDFLAGLQLSYLGIYGDGNKMNTDPTGKEVNPKYNVSLGMISYENPYIKLTGQYYVTNGNAKGKMVDENAEALKTQGCSIFLNFAVPFFERRFNLFGRYDFFDADVKDRIDGVHDTIYKMYTGGIAIKLYKSNMLLFVFEKTDYSDDNAGKGKVPVADTKLGKDQKFQAVLQIKL